MVSLGLVTHDHLEGKWLVHIIHIDKTLSRLFSLKLFKIHSNSVLNDFCLCRDSEQTSREEAKDNSQPSLQWSSVRARGTISILLYLTFSFTLVIFWTSDSICKVIMASTVKVKRSNLYRAFFTFLSLHNKTKKKPAGFIP